MVALSGDDLVAYVIGRVEEDPLLGDQRAVVDFAGCAAAGGQGDAIRDLYAALAARWVAAGATRHVAFVPASDEALLATTLAAQVAAADQRSKVAVVSLDALHGSLFAGTPDDVWHQLKSFYDHVGGFGHLLMMGQGGTISHEDTVANLTLFSREVLPRLAELG